MAFEHILYETDQGVARIRGIHRLTLRESARCVSLALWDEQSQRLISFRQAKALMG